MKPLRGSPAKESHIHQNNVRDRQTSFFPFTHRHPSLLCLEMGRKHEAAAMTTRGQDKEVIPTGKSLTRGCEETKSFRKVYI